ncbi:MAG: 50S ribosomal protein L20 [Candidatus Neomarinimicrobiota bacterium]|jgi:large subunit ribosomal protein L20|nr:MAG: 50S ribosomal protein L20 [Candidatus Neomarinimicrobiota bacterium]HIM83155.1 50S ribosomal protein L20 [Candidatus Neomarinimicrobiota bacterium]
MPRVTSAVPRKKRHKKILKQARGYFGASSRQYKSAKDAVEKAMLYNYRDRRQRRRNFRRLWITRINAAARLNGTTYSQLMSGLKDKNINLDRKVLAHLAVHEPEAFKVVVEQTDR